MELNDLANLMKTRRSVRAWQSKEVPEEMLLQAVELATWAPSGGNQQNWRFYVITNKSVLKQIADAVQETTDTINAWPESKMPGAPQYGGGRRADFFQSAPAAIAVAAAKYQSPVDVVFESREKVDPKAGEIRRWRNIADSRIQSVASAIVHMLLVFHQMGLGAVWMTGPTQAKDKIEQILKVPKELDVVAFIPVGFPSEVPVSRGRKPVNEVCEIIK